MTFGCSVSEAVPILVVATAGTGKSKPFAEVFTEPRCGLIGHRNVPSKDATIKQHMVARRFTREHQCK
jgi:imidazole glycerol phosphate synthase subunit HisF